MEPLVTNKKVLVFLCVCPPDESMSVGNRAICIISAVIIFLLNASVVEVHFSYFLTFSSVNLAESLYALMYGIAFCAPVYGMISTLFVRNEFGGIFRKLSAIYRASEFLNILIHNLSFWCNSFQFRWETLFIPISGASKSPKWMDVEVFFLIDDWFSDHYCCYDPGVYYHVPINQWKHWSWAIVSCVPCYVSGIYFWFKFRHLNIHFFSLAYRGTKHHTSDMLAKWLLL